MMLLRRDFLMLTAASLASVLPMPGFAQTYPTRPVRLLVPYAPAGPADILPRMAAQKLSEGFGKQFYVENVGGAGGNIGMGQGARAAPDGHTVLVVPPNIVINPATYDVVPYDPYKDFDPVTVAVSAPTVVTVHPSLKAANVSELVALIKTGGAKYSFLSPGTGKRRAASGKRQAASGKRSDRPKLAEALKTCRALGATLIIAKLDRLARNVHFVSGLMESGVEFTAVDFPQANRLTVHILAASTPPAHSSPLAGIMHCLLRCTH